MFYDVKFSAFDLAEALVAFGYVLGMFVFLVFRSAALHNPASFRNSYIMFFLYLILPRISHAFCEFLFGCLSVFDECAAQITDVIGAVLLGLSIFFAFNSISGKTNESSNKI